MPSACTTAQSTVSGAEERSRFCRRDRRGSRMSMRETKDPGRVTRRRRPLRRWALRATAAVIVLPLFLWLCFLAAVSWWPYPSGIDGPGPSASTITDRNGVILARMVAVDGQWRLPLPDDQISPHLLR